MKNSPETLAKLKELRAKIRAEIADARAKNRKVQPVVFGPGVSVIPTEGVGRELEAIFKALGQEPEGGCSGCGSTLGAMNVAGPAGCRKLIDRFAGEIRANAKLAGVNWLGVIKASPKMVITLARERLPPTIPGLIELACRRYEAKQR